MSFDDDTMAGAVRWRLGTLQYGGQSRRCKLAAVGHAGEAAEEVQQRAMRGECGAAMDVYGDHPQVCCLGAGFNLRHDPIVELLGHALRELGCLSRVECSMIGVFRRKGKTTAPGRLDVYAVGQAGLMEILIDVAVKHPCTDVLLPHAAERDGHAANMADKEKRREYILPAGKALTPFGAETFGRAKCRPLQQTAPDYVVGMHIGSWEGSEQESMPTCTVMQYRCAPSRNMGCRVRLLAGKYQ
jgi:hypothetical protein